jgi:uroporphyrinogen decarboxylase
MTERERVLEAVAHRDTDIVPYQLDFTQRAAEQTAEYLGDPDFMEKIGNHLAINDWGGFEEVRPNFFIRTTLAWCGTGLLTRISGL